MQTKRQYALIVLAAGGSSRMGTPKQLLSWGNTTLLGHALKQARGVSIQKKYLLLGANAGRIMEEVDITGFIPVINPGWEEGMGSGLAHVAETLLEDNPDTRGVLITLADQPLVTTALLEKVLEAGSTGEQEMAACLYGDRAGVPAFIGAPFVKQLLTLKGDQGCRILFKQYPEALNLVDAGSTLADIDTPEDYRKLYGEHNPGDGV